MVGQIIFSEGKLDFFALLSIFKITFFSHIKILLSTYLFSVNYVPDPVLAWRERLKSSTLMLIV